ncbi:uncharacterized protein Smp_201960 [Schistosoma mansoni]|uniref:uncharacterized protein n=1 Tax=Schistosoma mansoni TaxID=6183 RepID=UPI00022DC6CF|nr:uncharacterized protein Smp_201960 [Schistosoma mansoni]|eukprot:XP_018650694.1 uncharacterized protein Smp_201960 [Schistosoma mansoni]
MKLKKKTRMVNNAVKPMHRLMKVKKAEYELCITSKCQTMKLHNNLWPGPLYHMEST